MLKTKKKGWHLRLLISQQLAHKILNHEKMAKHSILKPLKKKSFYITSNFFVAQKLTELTNNAQIPITKRILKTADPTIVPIPTSVVDTNTPIRDIKTSGALDPAAIKVAPATSSSKLNR